MVTLGRTFLTTMPARVSIVGAKTDLQAYLTTTSDFVSLSPYGTARMIFSRNVSLELLDTKATMVKIAKSSITIWTLRRPTRT
jgi:hypothetical protein